MRRRRRPPGSGCRGGGRARALRRSRAGAGRGPPRGTSHACRRGRAERPGPRAPAARRAGRRGASVAPRRAHGPARARPPARRRAPRPRRRRARSASSGNRARGGSRLPAPAPRRSARRPPRVPARRAAPSVRRPRAGQRARRPSAVRASAARATTRRDGLRACHGSVVTEDDKRWREWSLGSRRAIRSRARPARCRPSDDDGLRLVPARPTSQWREERVVVLCHSAPGAGSFDPDPAVTRARNVRLISVDRPGYGGSSPVAAGAWATVASAADDLASVLDGLHVERVGVAGWSAGGRVALALAARRPDLVDRVAVLGTPAPDAEIPWIAPEQRDELERLRGLPPDAAHAELGERLGSLVPEDPHSPGALWLLGAGSADEARWKRTGCGSAWARCCERRSSRARTASLPTSPGTACGRGDSSRRWSGRKRSSCTDRTTRSPARDTDAGGRRGSPTRVSRSHREPVTS